MDAGPGGPGTVEAGPVGPGSPSGPGGPAGPGTLEGGPAGPGGPGGPGGTRRGLDIDVRRPGNDHLDERAHGVTSVLIDTPPATSVYTTSAE